MVRRLPDLAPAAVGTAALPGLAPATVPAGPAPPAADGQLRGQAHLVLRLVFEVLDGRRPAAQLGGMLGERARRYVAAAAGHLDDPAHPLGPSPRRYLRARARRLGGPGAAGAATLRSMRVCQPAAGAAEVSAVWRYRGRSRALAARFELTDRWRCTELRLG